MLSDLLKHIHDGCGIFTVGVGAVCVGWIFDTGVGIQTCPADGPRAHGVVTAQVGYTSAAGAALLRDDAHGEAKLVVDRHTGVVLGATFVGPGAGELIHAATIAITAGVPVHRLRHAVPAYPTASEIWLRLIESLPTDMLHPGQEIR